MWAILPCLAVAVAILLHWRRSGKHPIAYFGLLGTNVFTRLWHRLTTNGYAPLPAQGPAILVANHTCSADPFFVAAGCRRTLSYLIAHEYGSVKAFQPLLNHLGCIRVKRDGSDVHAIRLSFQRLREGRVLCIFPEAALSNAGRPRMRRFKVGVAYIALRSRAPLFPALVLGGPQTVNVLGAFLWPSRVRVRFGQAIDLSPYYDRQLNRALLEEVTRFIMQRIADLKLSDGKRTHPRMEASMNAAELTQKRCVSCEGDVAPLSPSEVSKTLSALPEWKLTAGGQRIRREWRAKDFPIAIDFFQRVGQLAEDEGHHPDLHLANYRDVAIEIWTHSVGGLTENDFILAAKIDKLPFELKQ